MSLKLKALLHVLAIVAIGTVGGSAVALLLTFWPANVVIGGLGVIFIVYLFSLMYQITLSRLESEARMQEMSKK